MSTDIEYRHFATKQSCGFLFASKSRLKRGKVFARTTCLACIPPTGRIPCLRPYHDRPIPVPCGLASTCREGKASSGLRLLLPKTDRQKDRHHPVPVPHVFPFPCRRENPFVEHAAQPSSHDDLLVAGKGLLWRSGFARWRTYRHSNNKRSCPRQ
jgi:hypothetical protein